MRRILGLIVVLLLAGCGVQGSSGQAPPGSIEAWTERIRQADSVSFDAEFRSEGRQPWWWTRKGEMSPLSKGVHTEGTPEPTQRMVERSTSYMFPDKVMESTVVERFSREVYLRDSRLTPAQGKSWVRLDINGPMWAVNAERDAVMTLNSMHPASVFIDLDPKTLVVSPAADDKVDGVPAWRYELTASANVGLPVKVVQRSTGEDGNKNTKVTKFSNWNATPPVAVPPVDQIGTAETATWAERW
jgi:hypothetical protein